jgi:hypothetical protein
MLTWYCSFFIIFAKLYRYQYILCKGGSPHPMIKQIETRICNKHDIELNWASSSLIPLAGEVIIYDSEIDAAGNTLELPNNRSVPYTYTRIKIGDGHTPVNDLPFIDEAIQQFSGDYNDLTNTPVLPKYVSDLDDDLGIATTNYVDLVKKQIPTLISQLENDSNYVNDADLQTVKDSIPDISNLADKEYVDSMVSTIPQFEIAVVETLPTEDISGTVVYLLKPTSEDADNFYDEYIYVNNTWELLGSARLDLTNYAKIENIPTKVSELENDSKFVSEENVEAYFKRLNSDNVLRFYCIEDVTIVNNGVSTVYPANSNVEVKFLNTDVWEIITTSDNSILALNGFPGALGTYYSWLEGVKQFSNILFDMNDVDFYSKWSQGNQGAYQVQYAQYINCIFWSDNPYVSDVSKRTNYTLYYTSQLPLCYSSIPDNTFKAFYLAFNVNSDPNWGNKAYRDSFAKATWATQVFSYYGARTIGVFGHDDPDFNITLPKDCRGLFCEATAVENAGTFDATNVTNFGAKSGSWRDAFRMCVSLRQLYIKNLKVNLNVSWSPIDYDSIYFILSTAANTKKITISLSPYTYNLLGPADFELAASKNITIEVLTTNYVEDRRLSAITTNGDGTQVLSNDGTYKALPTKTSQLENDSNFLTEHQSLENYVTKDELPDVSTFATQEALDTKADKSEIPDLTGLATESWVAEYVNEAVKDLENTGGTTDPQEPVTTDYTYSYDGNNSDDSGHTWISNYGGTKVLVKLGEIPEGTLNLVGASVSRVNPSNQWLDKTFTITEEHLTKVLNKADTDIPATQDGLIQIYDLMVSDVSEFTVLCICTKPGWYNVCFDNWFEIINFSETGIYGYDKRTYGGNDYLSTFTFSATVEPASSSNTGNNSSSNQGSNTISNPANYTGTEMQIFSRGICIGDSVTEGSFDNVQGGAVIKRFSYPSILKRLTNIDIVNAGIAGMTSQTWYEASLDSEPQWGRWVNQEWVWDTNPTNTGSDVISTALDYSGFEFAIIHMGINDLASVYDGTKTIDEVLTNFETYMNNIITKLKAANTGIKVFLATIIPSYAPATNSTYKQLNDKIKEMVEYTDNAYLLDLNAYSEVASQTAYNQTHPTALGYQKIAAEIYAMISYIIKNNLDEFNTVQFIGTDYTL